MDTFLLKVLDLFKGIFMLAKVDYDQLRAIVKVKLSMDNRRPAISFQRKQKTDPGNQFLWTLVFYFISGAFVALGLIGISSFMLGMIICFSFIMVLIIMTLITDFSSILLDTADNTIILPRPVDSRTLFVARITHIVLYLGQLAIGLSIVSIIVVAIKYGLILAVVFIITIGLSLITAVSLTNAFYLLLLQFSNEEKLKNIINYFQIIMAVFIMGGYQLLPRIAGHLGLETFVFDIQWWHYLLPPVWMAELNRGIPPGAIRPHSCFHDWMRSDHIPLLTAYMVNQYLTPIFSKKLGVLNESSQQNEKTENKGGISMANLSGWITRGSIEKGAFELVSKLLMRDRKIKLKIYPAFGYIIVFGLIFFIRGREDIATTWANLPSTQYYLILTYIPFIVLQVALAEIPYSDDFTASTIYFTSPLAAPGEILSGALKALFVRLFIPAYLVISIFILYVWGFTIILDDLVFGVFNNFIMLLIMAMIGNRYLPFSMAPNLRSQSGNLIRGLFIVIVIGALGVMHYLLTMVPYLVLAAIPFQLILIYFLDRHYKKTPWTRISIQ